MKICKKCGSSNFRESGHCIPCQLARQKKFREENKELVKARKAAEYQKNKDHILARVRLHKEKNREEIKRKQREKYAANKKEIRLKQDVYRKQNRDLILSNRRKKIEEKRIKLNQLPIKIIREQRKEERKRICPGCGETFYPRPAQLKKGEGKYCSNRCQGDVSNGSNSPFWKGGKETSQKKSSIRRREIISKGQRITKRMILTLGDLQKWKCVICKRDIKQKFHRDHIIPLARGGKHEITNIQLLCKICNCTKNDKDPIEFMQSRGFLL